MTEPTPTSKEPSPAPPAQPSPPLPPLPQNRPPDTGLDVAAMSFLVIGMLVALVFLGVTIWIFVTMFPWGK